MTTTQEHQVEPVGTPDATKNVLEECRMVLPGIQALFGFQLVVVFNHSFETLLGQGEQMAHLVALCMSALAIALVMGPAAYHRQVHPKSVSRAHVRVSSWLLTFGLIPLVLAIVIDVYLVTRIIAGSPVLAGIIAGFIFLVFACLWGVFPRWVRYKREREMLHAQNRS